MPFFRDRNFFLLFILVLHSVATPTESDSNLLASDWSLTTSDVASNPNQEYPGGQPQTLSRSSSSNGQQSSDALLAGTPNNQGQLARACRPFTPPKATTEPGNEEELIPAKKDGAPGSEINDFSIQQNAPGGDWGPFNLIRTRKPKPDSESCGGSKTLIPVCSSEELTLPSLNLPLCRYCTFCLPPPQDFLNYFSTGMVKW